MGGVTVMSMADQIHRGAASSPSPSLSLKEDKFVSQGDCCGDKGEGVIKGDSEGAERQRLTG